MMVRSGQGLTGWVARNRRTLVNARPSADFEVAGLTDHTTNLQSALVAPLVFNDRFIGTLALYHVQADFYTDDHRRLLDRVSEQASAVIHNSILFEQTQEDSLTDALTGLPNTRYLFMHLSRELARAERLKGEVALLIDLYTQLGLGRRAGGREPDQREGREPRDAQLLSHRSSPVSSACGLYAAFLMVLNWSRRFRCLPASVALSSMGCSRP